MLAVHLPALLVQEDEDLLPEEQGLAEEQGQAEEQEQSQ
jgi:hypothetical protein